MSYTNFRPETLIEQLRLIAGRAGSEILRYYRSAQVTDTVELKDDGSPVSIADRAAERVIIRALCELTPHLPIIAEESYDRSWTQDKLGHRFWLVDPLDGTVEFLKRNGEFTVNIALIENGLPIAAVIDGPAMEQQFFAIAGRGAFSWNPAQGVKPITCRQACPREAVVLLSRSHSDHKLADRWIDQNLRCWPKISRRYLGSSVKFCELASGKADCYPRPSGITHEWDTAAGQAILTAAGGRVETLDGQVLRYGKPGLVNPPYIARGLIELG